jgi:hypothetical protein
MREKKEEGEKKRRGKEEKGRRGEGEKGSTFGPSWFLF